jgi:initiation factor 1A
MVKNTKGGKKAKNLARKNIGVDHSLKYDDLVKTDEQEYARVLKVNGGNRYDLVCYSDKPSNYVNRLGISRGKINKTKVEVGTIVLISTRDYQPGKCDVLHIYNSSELQQLVNGGEIDPKFLKIEENGSSLNGGDNVQFGEISEEEEEFKFENL